MNVGAVVGEYFLFSWESHPNKQRATLFKNQFKNGSTTLILNPKTLKISEENREYTSRYWYKQRLSK